MAIALGLAMMTVFLGVVTLVVGLFLSRLNRWRGLAKPIYVRIASFALVALVLSLLIGIAGIIFEVGRITPLSWLRGIAILWAMGMGAALIFDLRGLYRLGRSSWFEQERDVFS